MRVRDEIVSRSPADESDVLGRFAVASRSDVGAAVERARAAFPAWRDAGFEARAAVLRRFRDLASARSEALAGLIAREMGKAIWDARGESKLLAAKVDVTLGEGMRTVAPIEAGPGVRTSVHPRGVLAVLGPYNFPAHLPNGHIVPALATGNTVVFKPSELTPTVGAFMGALWRDSGLPEGVLEIVQGPGETGAALASHPALDGVLFTGSYATGRALAELCLDQPGKLLALEMGGKNAIVVLDDADLDLALAETAVSICATTGQRCSCASRIFVHERLIDAFTDRLCALLAAVEIGRPLDESIFMGPLASIAAAEKVLRYRELAVAAGGERLLATDPGRPLPWLGAGLVRFASAEQSHPYQREEIFGPEAALYPIRDLDHAIAAVNDSDYGLVASLMTRSRARYEHAIGRMQTGLLNWNKGTIGASGKLPFGGHRRSGNDRPAGISAALYCTTHQAHLESEGGFDPSTLPPGMPRPSGDRA
jgi:succinylglutamic semialdehyde dehydrogenase